MPQDDVKPANSASSGAEANSGAPGSAPRRRRRRIIIALGLLLGGPVLLFIINGLSLARGESPYVEVISAAPPGSLDDRDPLTVKIFAFNIAKCFAFREGPSFDDTGAVNARVERIARVIRAEDPDFVFLSEVFTECGPCPVNQASSLAKTTGMHVWAFGENFNIGFPFYRIVSGNVILSRWPLEPVANPSLAGRQPFYVAKNNRRVLWCATQIGGRRVLLASIHNDSFDRDNNARQMQQILEYAGDQPTIMAGDFNAMPDWPAIELIRKSGRFAGAFDGPRTFPSDAPNRRIDFIFAPARWELLEERVIDTDVSDHLPVVSRFRVRS
jgi:endonuclease/exonuclease/phosphatase family metal-dependent hydrolase